MEPVTPLFPFGLKLVDVAEKFPVQEQVNNQ